MGRTNTQAQVAAEVAVANAETATIVANADVDTTANADVDTTANADVDVDDVITGTITTFNFIPAKDAKNGRAYNVIHIAVEGEDDDITAFPYDAQLENALSLNDAVAFVDVCDVRERRKNILFRNATIEFTYDDDEEVVIKRITLARASKAAALSGIN